MADHPDFYRSAEEALSRLLNFRTQNPLRVTTASARALPSPSPGLLSPCMTLSPSVPRTPPFGGNVAQSTSTQPQPSRTTASPTGYAPADTSAHHLAPANGISRFTIQSPLPQPSEPQAYEPQIYPEPLDRITYSMVYDRIFLLLRNNLTEWWTRNSEALHHVTNRMTAEIISHGTRGMFGPDGLSSLYQISMYFGHEGIYHYMCLVVHSGWSGLVIFLKGDLCEKDGKDPVHDEEMLALCKDGFDRAVAKTYECIFAERNQRRDGRR